MNDGFLFKSVSMSWRSISLFSTESGAVSANALAPSSLVQHLEQSSSQARCFHCINYYFWKWVEKVQLV